MVEESLLSGLSKHWQKFFLKFKEIDTLEVSLWKEVHMLAYFCRRYEQVFHTNFAVDMKNSAPGKSSDIYMIKKIKALLNTEKMTLVKEYIDWVFDNKINSKKQKFIKVGFLTTSAFINEFAMAKRVKAVITRASPVPESFKDVANYFKIDLNTYNDLAFILMAVKEDDKTSNYSVMLQNLELLGLNLNELRAMK